MQHPLLSGVEMAAHSSESILDDDAVYDIDMSRWYFEIVFYVGAENLPPVGGRFASFKIIFKEPSAFSFRPKARCSLLRGHPTLRIRHHEIIEDKTGVTLKLNGLSDEVVFLVPMTIRCRTIEVGAFSSRDLDLLRPGWTRPTVDREGHVNIDYGLIRPDVPTLARLVRAAKRSTP